MCTYPCVYNVYVYYVCMYVCTYVYICMYVRMCIYVYMYIMYVCMYVCTVLIAVATITFSKQKGAATKQGQLLYEGSH